MDYELTLAQQMRDEMIKQANKDRLAQEVAEEQRRQHKTYNPALAWVGRRMVTIGSTLLRQSGVDDDTSNFSKN